MRHISHEFETFMLDTDPYISCEECFERVDTEVEGLFTSGIAVDFATHLRGCPACLEEAETLVELIAEDFGESQAAGLERLQRAVA